MADILLLNPPFLPKFSRPQRSPAVTKSGTLYFPLFLAQAVAVLEADEVEVAFVDAPAAGLDLDAVVARAKAETPFLAVLDTSTPSIDADIAAAAALARVCLGVGVGDDPPQRRLAHHAWRALGERCRRGHDAGRRVRAARHMVGGAGKPKTIVSFLT